MKKLFLLLFIIVEIFYANESIFDGEFNLEEESEIATKSRLNIDYTPSIVTILKAETLEKLGAKDLFEALAFIPGIDTNRVRYFTEKLNGRGVFAVGQYKFLLNGTPLTEDLSQTSFPYFPIEHISRIEVIRGPNSTIYGGNAFSGVINIVTKKDENSFFLKKEFYSKAQNGETIGASFFHQIDDLKINILASQTKSDGDKIVVDNIPLENLENHHYSLIDLNYKNTNFTFLNSLQKYGNYYGLFNIPVNDGKNNLARKNSLVSLKHKFEINDNLSLNLSTYYLTSKIDFKDMGLFQYNINNSTQKIGISIPHSEKQQFFNLDLHYEFDKHNFLAGFYYKEAKDKDARKKLTFSPNFVPFLSSYEMFNNLFPEGLSVENGVFFGVLDSERNVKRVNRAFYFQDIYKVNDKLSLTLGVRSDNYSDIDNSFVPKIAGVYEINEENIIKAQFAKAFRAPSFFEIYNFFPNKMPTENLKSEVIDTYELAHILKKDDYSLKTNLFYSKLKNLIFSKDIDISKYYLNPDMLINFDEYSYSNVANANSKGIEVEFIKNYGENLILNSNFSYSEAKYKNINISKIDNFMFNLALFIKPYSTSSLSIWYKYINENVKEISNKHNSRSHHILDLNFEKIFILNNNTITARVGVKNLFDSEYRYFDENNLNLQANGRSIWAGISYEF